MKKPKKYSMFISYNKTYTVDQLADLVSQLFGYDITQATNCALFIVRLGRYKIKEYKQDKLNQAIELSKLADSHNLDTELVPM